AAVGKGLVLDAGFEFPMVIHFVGDAGRGQNVEREILSLLAVNIGVAVEPAQTDSAGNVEHPARPGFGEVVTEAERDAVIKIPGAARERLGQEGGVNLIVTLDPTVALDAAPAPAVGKGCGSDL